MEKFELHIADTNVSSGTVSVGWCVPREVLAYLKAEDVKDPQVVIVVSPEENYHIKKEHRVVVPLKDLIAYVEFRCSGRNKIYGFIPNMNAKQAKTRYLHKQDGEYYTDILNYQGDDFASSIKFKEEDGVVADPLSVQVPKECFAPEPREWEKNWVNWLHRDKCVDQCDFRRRRLFAYSVQPFLFALMYSTFAVATLAAALFGARALTLSHLRSPLSSAPSDLIDMFIEGTVFVRKGDTFLKRYWSLPFMPAILLSLASVVLLMVHWHVALYTPLVILLICLGFIFSYCFAKYMIQRQIEKADRAALEEPWYTNENEAVLMVCSPGKRLTKLSDLPKQKRTLRLRFLDLKSKVCRPFSA